MKPAAQRCGLLVAGLSVLVTCCTVHEWKEPDCPLDHDEVFPQRYVWNLLHIDALKGSVEIDLALLWDLLNDDGASRTLNDFFN